MKNVCVGEFVGFVGFLMMLSRRRTHRGAGGAYDPIETARRQKLIRENKIRKQLRSDEKKKALRVKNVDIVAGFNKIYMDYQIVHTDVRLGILLNAPCAVRETKWFMHATIKIHGVELKFVIPMLLYLRKKYEFSGKYHHKFTSDKIKYVPLYLLDVRSSVGKETWNHCVDLFESQIEPALGNRLGEDLCFWHIYPADFINIVFKNATYHPVTTLRAALGKYIGPAIANVELHKDNPIFKERLSTLLKDETVKVKPIILGELLRIWPRFPSVLGPIVMDFF